MTMYRYMAFMWSHTDQEASQAARFLAAKLHKFSPHAWRQAWQGTGLTIYHSGEHTGRMQTCCFQGERGAVLGRLFRSDYTPVVNDFDEFESRKCLETRGQHLVDNYWGRYVAFLNNPKTGTRYVMRDPTGAFPCFHTSFRGVTIYFSDMQDAANFDFLPFTVNWEFIRANIVLPQFQKTITGLNEVWEVLPAECVEVTPVERKSRFVWNPTEISQSDVIEDPEEAADLMRETVRSTIGALARCYERVVHNLGGLDSSIALACMAQAAKRPEIVCINFFTRSPRGEERRYSRQVVEMHDADLVERKLDYRKADLSKIFKSNMLARPLGFFDCIGLTGDVLALAQERGAQALTYGVGGDNVFYQPPRNFGALDYVRCHGLLKKNLLRVAIEASRYGRMSLLSTFNDMLREYVSPIPCYKHVHDKLFQRRKVPLVNPDFVTASRQEPYLHPLLIPDEHMAKGKYHHILMCALFSLEYYNHWDISYSTERVNMYLSQPIVEACLRIPVWVLTYGGVERGLARLAFRNDLPKQVVTRFSKSTPGEFYKEIYANNVREIREYLLDGIMLQEQILLRDRLDAVLCKQDCFLDIKPSMVLGYLGTEAWVRRWIERPVDRMRRTEVAL